MKTLCGLASLCILCGLARATSPTVDSPPAFLQSGIVADNDAVFDDQFAKIS